MTNIHRNRRTVISTLMLAFVLAATACSGSSSHTTSRASTSTTAVRESAAQLAAEGFDVAVINPRVTKPIDPAVHEQFGREADLIVTLEDHVLMGGYGSAVLELFNEQAVKTPVIRIGWPDQFIEHATTQDELRKKYGLSVENTVARVKNHFGETVAITKLVG